MNRILELLRLTLFLGGLAWIGYNIVAWRTAEYVTNLRVLGTDGLLRRRSTDTLLTSIADVRTVIPWLGRMLGFGHIRIMSASGAAGADELHERARRGGIQAGDPRAEEEPSPSAPNQ